MLESVAEDLWAMCNEVFDETGENCECCSGYRFNNYNEKQLALQIRALAKKAEHLAATLKNHIAEGHPPNKHVPNSIRTESGVDTGKGI